MAAPEGHQRHAFDKLRLLDCTLAEFELAIEHAVVIEETELPNGAKELVVTVE